MAEVKLYSAIINEAGEQAWAVLEADYARLSELKDTLVEALRRVRAQLAAYERRSMWGTECDSDVENARAEVVAALSGAALFEQERGRG